MSAAQLRAAAAALILGTSSCAIADIDCARTDLTCQPAWTLLRIPDPVRIAGLQLWLRADDAGQLDGNPVASWIDRSANANTVAQSTSANQPTYRTEQLNGQAAVRFDGGDFLSGANTSLAGRDFTLFVVMRRANTAASHSILEVGQASLTNAKLIGQGTGSNTIDLCSRNVNCMPAFGSFSAAAFHILTLTYAGSSSGVTEQYADTGFIGRSTTSLAFDSQGGLFVGSAPNGAAGWNGEIAEVIYYDRVLQGGEIGQLHCYLTGRYGLGTVSC